MASCKCGCGSWIAESKTFKMGHDARHKANLKKAIAARSIDALKEAATFGWVLDRTFGVEIELTGVTPTQVVRALRSIRNVNLDVQRWGATRDYTRWVLTTDGSVTSRGSVDPNYPVLGSSGLELVSPVLFGMNGMKKLQKVLDALVNAGATVNRSCGIHVHIGAADLDTKALKALHTNYADAQTAELDSFLLDDRKEGSHGSCSWAKIVRRPEAIAAQIRAALHGGRYDRYAAVNLANFVRRGTVEFRQMQGSVNAENVCSWVIYCMELVQAARFPKRHDETMRGQVRLDGCTTRMRMAESCNNSIAITFGLQGQQIQIAA